MLEWCSSFSCFWFSFLSFPFRLHFLLFNFSSPSLLPFFPFLPPFHLSFLLLLKKSCLFLPLRPTLTKLTKSCDGHLVSLLLSLPLCSTYNYSSYLLHSMKLFIALLHISHEFLFAQSHPHSSPSLHTIPSNHPSVRSSLSGRQRSQSRFLFLYPFVFRFSGTAD